MQPAAGKRSDGLLLFICTYDIINIQHPLRKIRADYKMEEKTMQNASALEKRRERRSFYKMTFRITMPIVLQNLMDSAVNAADVIMMSFVSQAALSASSLANQVYFVLSCVFFGLAAGTSVMASQYWGKGDIRTIERVVALAIKLALGVALVFAAAAWFAPGLLMKIFTNDPELIAEGARYLRAVGASYVFNGFCSIYLCSMRCVERVNMSAAVHAVAVVMNVALNACFIFGFGPFPELGIVGVALATTITRAVETIICILDSRFKGIIKLRIRDFLARNWALMKEFLRYALPSMGNDMIWGLATTVYSVILGHLSSDMVAANSLNGTVRNLATVVCFGFSGSAAIILGKTMGDSRLEDARRYSARFVWLSIISALVGGAVILALRPVLLGLTDSGYFKLSAQAKEYFSTMLYISSYYVLGMSLNTMLVCGVYRAGGDVKFGLIMDACTMWGYAVPAGLLCAFVFKIPPMWVYFVLCLDEFVKIPVIVRHYFKYSWLKNITREDI